MNAHQEITSSPAQAIAEFAQSQPALYAQLSVLERFNGQPVIERYTRATNASYYDATTGSYKSYTFYTVSIEPQRLPFFQSAYDSLKASTYQSLYLQTEGKQLLDQIELVIDTKGLRLDFAAVNSTLATKAATDPAQAATDLAEFIAFTTDSLASSGWDGAAQLGDLLETATLSPAQIGAMQVLRFQTGRNIQKTYTYKHYKYRSCSRMNLLGYRVIKCYKTSSCTVIQLSNKKKFNARNSHIRSQRLEATFV